MRRCLSIVCLLAMGPLVACREAPTGRARSEGRVLFTTGAGPATEIWDMDANGTGRRRLTRNDLVEAEPRWLAGGGQIIFARARVTTSPPSAVRFEIHIMDADGSNVRRIAESPSSDRHPTHSFAASAIAFLSTDLTTEGSVLRLYTMRMDGTDRRLISPGLVVTTQAEWSQDGTELLFGAWRSGETAMELFLANADGTDPRVIPDPCAGPFELGRWSPDYSQISLMCLDGGNWPIYIVAASGTNVRRLTPPWSSSLAIDDLLGAWSSRDEVLVVRCQESLAVNPARCSPSDLRDPRDPPQPEMAQELFAIAVSTGAARRVGGVPDPTSRLWDWFVSALPE